MILDKISSLTDAQKRFIIQLIEDLGKIENIYAIALGGSHATGRANASSDIDMGLYYYESAPFSIKDIREIAEKNSTGNTAVVVDFYEWGPWVNGGAWINTEIGKVDLLYRNIDQIENTISNAKAGRWENHFEQQPPYGFTSMIYLAESQACVPLFDPHNILNELKKSTADYPQVLKKNVVNTALWSAEFTLAHAGGFALKKDMYNTLGCLTRSLKSITEALFALNETYPIGDKGAIQILSRASIVPENLEEKVNKVLMADVQNLDTNITLIKELFAEVVDLTKGLYHPKFELK